MSLGSESALKQREACQLFFARAWPHAASQLHGVTFTYIDRLRSILPSLCRLDASRGLRLEPARPAPGPADWRTPAIGAKAAGGSGKACKPKWLRELCGHMQVQRTS